MKNASNRNYRQKKKRIFDIIQIGQRDDFLSRAFDIFIVTVIILNISIMFAETFEQLDGYSHVFKVLETATIVVFCIEYILRIWTSEFLYPDCTKFRAVTRFFFSFDGIVDLLTILPFFFLSGFVAFRMLRVVRIFHLFRINAYYDSFNVITSVLYEKRNQIISSVFIIFILMMCSSLCMYSVEHEAQPGVFDNCFSGMWWSISTILTVGYGDIYPITVLGRFMAIIISLLGVGVVAIPTGIISAGFVEQYTHIQQNTGNKQTTTGTLTVTSSSPLLGKTLTAFERERKTTDVVVVIRDGNVIVPNEDTTLEKKDIIIYQEEIK